MHAVNGVDVVLPHKHNADGLNHAEYDCDVTRDLRDLLTAFFTVFTHFFQFRNDERQKLHYDETIDKRDDSESKKRTL